MITFIYLLVFLVSPILTIVVEGQLSKLRKRCTSESGNSKGRFGKNYDTKLEIYRHDHSSIHFISAYHFVEDLGERCSKLVVCPNAISGRVLKRSQE